MKGEYSRRDLSIGRVPAVRREEDGCIACPWGAGAAKLEISNCDRHDCRAEDPRCHTSEVAQGQPVRLSREVDRTSFSRLEVCRQCHALQLSFEDLSGCSDPPKISRAWPAASDGPSVRTYSGPGSPPPTWSCLSLFSRGLRRSDWPPLSAGPSCLDHFRVCLWSAACITDRDITTFPFGDLLSGRPACHPVYHMPVISCRASCSGLETPAAAWARRAQREKVMRCASSRTKR